MKLTLLADIVWSAIGGMSWKLELDARKKERLVPCHSSLYLHLLALSGLRGKVAMRDPAQDISPALSDKGLLEKTKPHSGRLTEGLY